MRQQAVTFIHPARQLPLPEAVNQQPGEHDKAGTGGGQRATSGPQPERQKPENQNTAKHSDYQDERQGHQRLQRTQPDEMHLAGQPATVLAPVTPDFPGQF